MADTDTSEDEILDEEGDEAADGAPAKKGRRKLILFALIGVLVIGGDASVPGELLNEISRRQQAASKKKTVSVVNRRAKVTPILG